MKQLGYIGILMTVLAFAACGGKKHAQTTANQVGAEQQEQAEQPEHLVIQYVRTPCFGTCPHFELDVYSTGRAQYNGKRFVQNEGVFTGTWSSEDIMAVFEAAEEINYFELQSTYDNRLVMDLPSVTTRILSGDTLKSVMNRYQGPPELNELYKVLDQVISQTNWTAAGQ